MSKKGRVKQTVLALAVLAALTVSGCRGEKKQKDTVLRVGVVTYTQDDPFINAMSCLLYTSAGMQEEDMWESGWSRTAWGREKSMDSGCCSLMRW